MGRVRIFKNETANKIGEHMVKKWEVNKVNNEEVEQFAKKYKISNLLASILVRKEIKTDEEVAKFLHPTRMDFYNPFLLPRYGKGGKKNK